MAAIHRQSRRSPTGRLFFRWFASQNCLENVLRKRHEKVKVFRVGFFFYSSSMSSSSLSRVKPVTRAFVVERDERNCHHCRANSEINTQAHQRLVLKYCVFIFGVRFVIRSRSLLFFFCITLAHDSVIIKCVSSQSNRCLVVLVVVGWQSVSQWCVIRSV